MQNIWNHLTVRKFLVLDKNTKTWKTNQSKKLIYAWNNPKSYKITCRKINQPANLWLKFLPNFIYD